MALQASVSIVAGVVYRVEVLSDYGPEPNVLSFYLFHEEGAAENFADDIDDRPCRVIKVIRGVDYHSRFGKWERVP